MLSSPELTAMDLIYYEKRTGGLNRAAEIIRELSLDFRKTGDDFWRLCKPPVIQRLGFILENVLGLEDISADVYQRSKSAGICFRKTMLDPISKAASTDFPNDGKWKIIVNCELEVDI